MSGRVGDEASVRRVLDAHRQEIMQRFHAVGVGLGRDGADYVVTVFLSSEDDRPRVEVSIEGVRLKFEVTGPFRAQSSGPSR
jgi:hypothetical protein